MISFLDIWNKDNFWESTSVYCDFQKIIDI